MKGRDQRPPGQTQAQIPGECASSGLWGRFTPFIVNISQDAAASGPWRRMGPPALCLWASVHSGPTSHFPCASSPVFPQENVSYFLSSVNSANCIISFHKH